ncbi:Cation/multidrug efflux pump, membrane-fusion protein [Oceaniovalibus guishaninsula JLT2003]|uniref:Cation/multidrug efflux pump, membrane-fusion protein n=1 Tax=Oceaniovalibus guishaninsula JLT2003 TaxID=1231392 RepID=K2HM38_9RHOB|nr:efflux RND transporter periplasmic adaptor subunit [Oceaniovalibus guishaninsula]EKE43949.1 Cation/multidrug efflux pump, membrane-fusion protein [Oceaniovalibus guishaninsula JLT2003]
MTQRLPHPGRTLRALALCLLSASPLHAQQGAGDRPPPAVTVVTMEPQQVVLTTTLPGRVVASAEAEVRPQVAGIITERLFEEGGRVETGDPLYRIDPATYDAAVASAEASVAQAQAELDRAQKNAARIDELRERQVVSVQNADEADAELASARANLQAAQAQLASAQIEQDRTTIRARLSGEIGRSFTSQGALVTASQAEPLAVIRNIDPVYVDVTQSSADLLEWRRNKGPGQMRVKDPVVSLVLADGTLFDQTGTLTAAEPHVDEQTGVITLRMTFDNPDKLLLPGMYVQVEMPTDTLDGAFLVPQEGVSRDRRGQATAMVVNADNIVEQHELSVVKDRGGEWIVDGGIADGDRVIVAGLQKVAPGAPVTPEERAPANPVPADERAEAVTD